MDVIYPYFIYFLRSEIDINEKEDFSLFIEFFIRFILIYAWQYTKYFHISLFFMLLLYYCTYKNINCKTHNSISYVTNVNIIILLIHEIEIHF